MEPQYILWIPVWTDHSLAIERFAFSHTFCPCLWPTLGNHWLAKPHLGVCVLYPSFPGYWTQFVPYGKGFSRLTILHWVGDGCSSSNISQCGWAFSIYLLFVIILVTTAMTIHSVCKLLRYFMAKFVTKKNSSMSFDNIFLDFYFYFLKTLKTLWTLHWTCHYTVIVICL